MSGLVLGLAAALGAATLVGRVDSESRVAQAVKIPDLPGK